MSITDRFMDIKIKLDTLESDLQLAELENSRLRLENMRLKGMLGLEYDAVINSEEAA